MLSVLRKFSKNKLLIYILIGSLSLLFFINIANRFLYPSRATGEPVYLFFNVTSAEDIQPDEEIPINIFMASEKLVSGATVVINYPPDKVEFIEKDENYTDDVCRVNNFVFNSQPKVINDSEIGQVSITRIALKKNENLPKGIFCFGTAVFKLKQGVKEANIKFSPDEKLYEIVGPQSKLSAKVENDSSVSLVAVGSNQNKSPSDETRENIPCTKNSDCSSLPSVCNEYGCYENLCINNVCTPFYSLTSPTPTLTQEPPIVRNCKINSDCMVDEVCSVGICVKKDGAISPTITPTRTTSQTAHLEFSPSFISLEKGKTMFVDIMLDTGPYEVLASDIRISFDPQKLSYINAVEGNLPFKIGKVESEKKGELYISTIVPEPGKAFKGRGVIAKITFKAVDSGSSILSFVCYAGETALDSNIVENSYEAKDIIDCFSNNIARVIIDDKTLPDSSDKEKFPEPCPLSFKGDASCDGKCDMVDFEIFRREKLNIENTLRSDANKDGKVDLVDFNIWKNCYFNE